MSRNEKERTMTAIMKTSGHLAVLLVMIIISLPSHLPVYSEEDNHDGVMHWPLEGDYMITSYFGYRIFNGVRWHSGVDIAPLGSTPNKIFAADSGTVIFAGEWGDYGNVIMIRHCEEIVTLYAHMVSADEVELDDKVERGDPIGRAGKTGNATGVHVHFEVRVDGIPQDPLPYLGKESLPPVNDQFADRIPFKDFNNVVTVRGTNDGATREEGEPLHGNKPGGRSVWWNWTPPHEGLFYFKTENNNFNTILGVYTGSALADVQTEAVDDHAGGDVYSLFHAHPDTEYNIAVDGYDGASGFFYLSWVEFSAGSVNGRVYDRDSGEPVPEAMIIIRCQDHHYETETFTDKDGNYSFSHMPVGQNEISASHHKYNSPEKDIITVEEGESITLDISLDPYIPGIGDVNGDGDITVVDAILILRHIVGLTDLTPEQQQRANVSGLDEINITDAILILRYITGLIEQFPVE